MVRYVEGKFDEDYVETLGVNFMEKTISLPTAEIMMSLWDLGGAKEVRLAEPGVGCCERRV
jgi:Gtp-binding protein of the ras superfamily involved in termination of M-phase